MKKIKREDLRGLREIFPVLTEAEMRQCIGGATSWDCLFQCMHWMDPTRTVSEYTNVFIDKYNIDPQAIGGVPSNYNSDVLSSFGFGHVQLASISSDANYFQVIILQNPDGTSHAVMACSPAEGGMFTYYDPTTGKYQRGKETDIQSIYAIQKKDVYNPWQDNNGYYSDTNGYNYSDNDYSNLSGDYNYNNMEYLDDNGYFTYWDVEDYYENIFEGYEY